MIVQTGFIEAGSIPWRSLCSRPLSTASATAIACATVKHTVAFTLTPLAVACSIPRIPAAVAGNFTCMLGASALNLSACSSMRSELV